MEWAEELELEQQVHDTSEKNLVQDECSGENHCSAYSASVCCTSVAMLLQSPFCLDSQYPPFSLYLLGTAALRPSRSMPGGSRSHRQIKVEWICGMLVGSKLSQAPKIIIPTGLFAFHSHSFSFSHNFFTLQCQLLFKSFPNLPSNLKLDFFWEIQISNSRPFSDRYIFF